MAIIVNDVLNLVRDYTRNQNLETARGIRAINTATDLVFSHLGITTQERESSFLFFDDQYKYDAPDDFGEPISLRFDDDQLNANQRFEFKPGELLWERVKFISNNTRLWGTYSAAGTQQIYMISKNSKAGTFVDSFDSDNDTNWTPSDDASNVRDDLYTKKEGSGSLKFDTLVNVANRASLTRTISAFDMSSFIDVGYFRAWVYLPNITNFTSISFNWGNDSSNYYKQTVTAQEDGTAFIVGWNAIAFPWLNSTLIGTVNTSLITFLKWNFDYAAGFTPSINWRLDFLRIVVPDEAILSYYTLNKGTTTLDVPLQVFTLTTDKFTFTDYSLQQLIAVQAAVILNPQILVDDRAVRQIYNDFSMLYKRKYPRKKVNNLLAEPPVAKSSHH